MLTKKVRWSLILKRLAHTDHFCGMWKYDDRYHYRILQRWTGGMATAESASDVSDAKSPHEKSIFSISAWLRAFFKLTVGQVQHPRGLNGKTLSPAGRAWTVWWGPEQIRAEVGRLYCPSLPTFGYLIAAEASKEFREHWTSPQLMWKMPSKTFRVGSALFYRQETPDT